MPDLDRVAQLAAWVGGEPRAAGDARVVLTRELRRLGAGARQRGEKRVETLAVVGEARRELPEERAELVLELEQAGREEVRERRVHSAEPEHVGDVARPLDGEYEAVRHSVAPARVALGALQRVEAAVELDRGETLRRELELALLRQSFGIEVAAPGRVTPAGDANVGAHRYAPHT